MRLVTRGGEGTRRRWVCSPGKGPCRCERAGEKGRGRVLRGPGCAVSRYDGGDTYECAGDGTGSADVLYVYTTTKGACRAREGGGGGGVGSGRDGLGWDRETGLGREHITEGRGNDRRGVTGGREAATEDAGTR